eukprot:scaffold14030_cov25-Prasinocladus_malaysianus.AAC.1
MCGRRFITYKPRIFIELRQSLKIAADDIHEYTTAVIICCRQPLPPNNCMVLQIQPVVSHEVSLSKPHKAKQHQLFQRFARVVRVMMLGCSLRKDKQMQRSRASKVSISDAVFRIGMYLNTQIESGKPSSATVRILLQQQRVLATSNIQLANCHMSSNVKKSLHAFALPQQAEAGHRLCDMMPDSCRIW